MKNIKSLIARVAKSQKIYTGANFDNDKSVIIEALIEHKGGFRIQLAFKMVNGKLHAEVSGSHKARMKFVDSSKPLREHALRKQIAKTAARIGAPFAAAKQAIDFLDALVEKAQR